MTFAFVKTDKAFLPALEGYPAFFSKYGIQCEIVTKNDLRKIARDLEWFFMGTDYTRPTKHICKIHEYISPSIAPFSTIKNLYKTIFNTRPHCRIFKNEYVKESFSFKDNIPFYFQDIGISQYWQVQQPASEKEFDFIYVGELSPRRVPDPLLERFTKADMQQHTLLLLSKNYDALQKRYQAYPNIIFKGPVDKVKVKEYIFKSRFGINYIPDLEPFNQLTSTKLLEYAACNLPIISTRYPWIERFQQQYKGSYYFLSPDLSNFTWEAVNNHTYSSPDLKEWTWEQQIRKSGVLGFLELRFPGLQF